MTKPPAKRAQKRIGPEPISIFISYSHDDTAIARAVKEEISTIDHKGFDVFLDFESIEVGGNWKQAIEKAVEAADVFIAIFTGNQKHVFDYCGYEVGLFSAAANRGRRRRMFCVYDTQEPPTILRDLEGVQIAYDGNSDKNLRSTDGWQSEVYAPRMKDIFKLCYELYRKRFKEQLADLSEAKSRELIQAFYANKGDELIEERPLHARLMVTLPAVTDWEVMQCIPATSTAEAEIATFNILGLPSGIPQLNAADKSYSIGWKALVDALGKRAGNIVPWISYVEASILAQLKAGNSEPPQLSFLGADGKSYRPVIGRFEVFRNGTRRYYVQLIPTMEKSFPGRPETSFPLIGLIFAARFWFKFCEDEEAFLRAFAADKSDVAFDLEVRSLDSYLQRMIAEASEFGLSDKESMKKLMKEDDATLVDHFFEVWHVSYGDLSSLLKNWFERKGNKKAVIEGLVKFVRDVKPLNLKFMQMMFEELSAKLFRNQR
jgi:TIR domain